MKQVNSMANNERHMGKIRHRHKCGVDLTTDLWI